MYQDPGVRQNQGDQARRAERGAVPPWIEQHGVGIPPLDPELQGLVLFERTTLYMPPTADAKTAGPLEQCIYRAKELLVTTRLQYTPHVTNAPRQIMTVADYLEYRAWALLTEPVIHPQQQTQTTLLDEIKRSLGLGHHRGLADQIFRTLAATEEARILEEEVDETTFKNVLLCATHLLGAKLEANAVHRVLESLNHEMLRFLDAAFLKEFSELTLDGEYPDAHPIFGGDTAATHALLAIVQKNVVEVFHEVMISPASLEKLFEDIGIHAGHLHGFYQSWVASTGYPLGYPNSREFLDHIHHQLEQIPGNSLKWETILIVGAMLRSYDPSKYGHLESYINPRQTDISSILAEVPRKNQAFMNLVAGALEREKKTELTREAAKVALISKDRKSLPGSRSAEPSILKLAISSNGYKTPALAAVTAVSLGFNLVTSSPELTHFTLALGSITCASALWKLPAVFSKLDNRVAAQLPRYVALGSGLHFLYESIPQSWFYNLPSVAFSIIHAVPFNPVPRIAAFTALSVCVHQLILSQESQAKDNEDR